MSIDEQPMNVYWSGQRTETINRSKINYKGSVTAFSDLPDTDNQKGDMYSVTNLNGENYIWDGTAWDSLGTSDANVVHKTGNETVAGTKRFESDALFDGTVCSLLPIDKYETPSTAKFKSIIFGWKKASGEPNGRIAGLEIGTRENGVVDFDIFVYPNIEANPYSWLRLLLIQGQSPDYARCLKSYKATANNVTVYTNLGDSTDRWGQIYTTSSVNVSSDERLKESIAPFPDEVLDAWGEVNFCQFQFKNSVAQKSSETARLHSGVIAQRVDEAFKRHGLDAGRYGLFCYDEWDARIEERDEEGNVTQPAEPAGNEYSIRYEEALCMEAAYQRRRAERAEARIKTLEDRLEALEAKLA